MTWGTGTCIERSKDTCTGIGGMRPILVRALLAVCVRFCLVDTSVRSVFSEHFLCCGDHKVRIRKVNDNKGVCHGIARWISRCLLVEHTGSSVLASQKDAEMVNKEVVNSRKLLQVQG